jgi:hypothetical protein
MTVVNVLSFYGSYSAKIACIWFSVWAIRKKADADYSLDRPVRVVRWIAVVVGFAVGYCVPKPEFWYVRVAGGFLGLAFLCWPNFAYHLMNVSGRGEILN